MRPLSPFRRQRFCPPVTLLSHLFEPRRLGRKTFVILLIGTLLAVSGCGSPVRPDTGHLERVKQAVLEAQQEGLAAAAPVEMEQCKQALQAAEVATQNGDFGQAESLLKRIEVDLQTARLRAQVNRLNQQLQAAKKRNAEAEQQLSEMQEALHAD